MLRFSTLLTFLLSCGAGCLALSEDKDDRPAEKEWERIWSASAPTGHLVERSNRFALDLYDRLRTPKGDLFFSPYSVSTALAMTSAGARGQTLDEMARVLHFPEQTELHPAMAWLMAGIRRHEGEDIEMTTANALWGQKGRTFCQDFLALTRRHYAAGFREVDYIGGTESARRSINDWTAAQTRRRVTDLLPPGVITPMSRLVLTNAIYFKAKWDKAFDKANTREGTFYVGPKGPMTNPMMMTQTARFGYAEVEGCQVLEMPYAGKQFSLVILLPERCADLAELERSMTTDLSSRSSRAKSRITPESLERERTTDLTSWLAALAEQEVDVTVPRFEMAQAFSLKPTLEKMGVAKAFSADADFTGIDDGLDHLRLGDVIHKAFVEVDEDGTKAAAATAVEARSLSVPRQTAAFIADRPFVYLIRDRQTGCILFMGRYTGK